jgi:parallel beta-helix repeat protein
MSRKPWFDRLEDRKLMATFAVTSAADTNTAGTLRWAITQANATPAADVINFNLLSTTITPATALPAIVAPVTIDATTQPGYAGKPLITIDGSSSPLGTSGFNIQANDVLIRGLAVGGFDDLNTTGGLGVAVGIGALRATIRDCYIGLWAGGQTALPNSVGIRSRGPNAQVIDSIVSSNERFGIWISEDGNKVLGTTVGLPAMWTNENRPNGSDGVRIDDGSFCVVQDSVISGNAGWGVHVLGTATSASVDRNIIGMTPDRTSRRANTLGGVYFNAVTGSISNNRIAAFNEAGVSLLNTSGITVQANNIGFGANPTTVWGGSIGIRLENVDNSTLRLNQIGHQLEKGIYLLNSDGNSIRRNGVGTLLDNTLDLGNTMGIHVVNGFDNQIGIDGEGNAVSNSNGTGIHIESGERNPILANVFTNNATLDIDLGPQGWTPNDGNDADTGANTLLNTTEAVWGAYNVPGNNNQTTIGFRYGNQTVGGGSYRVDFYKTDAAKTSGVGGGSRHLGSDTINFSSGPLQLQFYRNVPIEVDGTLISATVTRLVNGVPTDTSEFSTVMRVEGAPQIVSSEFSFETRHQFEFGFSRSVNGSIDGGEISVRNLATNQLYTPNRFAHVQGNRVRWWFDQPLPDGNYRATLDRTSVTSVVDVGATNMSLQAVGPNTIDFHVLAGDANRDKSVNFTDLLVLAQNYGQTGRTFSQGDFNYDGTVNFGDLLLLAQRYGQQLSAASAPIAPMKKRIATSIFA